MASILFLVVARPIIGISGPDRGGLAAWLFTSWAVRVAGGHPIWIRPGRPRRSRRIDAVILGGGADVDPERYGENDESKPDAAELERRIGRARMIVSFVVAPIVYVLRRMFGLCRMFGRRRSPGIDRARDDLELALLDRAATEHLPVLGICRGAQLINVWARGTLQRDLHDFYVEQPNPWTVLPRKIVRIAADSGLAQLLGSTECVVNSLHRHAVAALGHDLRVVARDENGVIQAIEDLGGRFWVGVQWHPEYLPQQPEQRRLFRGLVRVAAGRRNRDRSPRRT